MDASELIARYNAGERDFEGADLSNADLRGVALGAEAPGPVKLGRANLSGANLAGARLYGARLGGASLCYADLRGADLHVAGLGSADLRQANLSGADLRWAQFIGARVDAGTQMDEKWYLVWQIVNQQANRSSLAGRDLAWAWLLEADLEGANLSRANLSNANLSRANLRGADLRAAQLAGTSLSAADLTGADLAWASLHSAQIGDDTRLDTEWRLVWQIVNGKADKSRLAGQNLSRADLHGADLSGADLSKADMSTSLLNGADLRGASLRLADMGGADLTDANVAMADLELTNLLGAKVTREQLATAEYLTGATLPEGSKVTERPGGTVGPPISTSAARTDSPLTGSRFFYNYAHVALPILALGNPKKFYKDVSSAGGKQYLIHMWQGLAGRMGQSQPHQGLGLHMETLGPDTEIALIHMPVPTVRPEAFHIGIPFRIKKQFLRTEALSARYFTLELGYSPDGRTQEYHFCEWVGPGPHLQHCNYGRLPGADERAFVEAIKGML